MGMTGGAPDVEEPRIIVFDSGLGGLTVYGELHTVLPYARYLYVADNEAFPYGDLREEELVTRLLALFDMLVEREKPDICVIACNTASTIALAPLREHFEVPFVGTVPAVKTAAEQSRSGLFSVLATPGTVARVYTRDLIERYARDCDVTLVGAKNLAGLAERAMRGEAVNEEQLLQEIRPAFVEREGRRTDIITLGCTHYPLLVDLMEKVAPWPVTYIDPAPAIARQTKTLLSQKNAPVRSRIEPGKARTGNQLIYTGDDLVAGDIAQFLQKLSLLDVVHDGIIG